MAERNPRLPVLIGVGQVTNRVNQGAAPLEPAELMAEALRAAEADSGCAGALAGADSIRVINELSWRYRNPGAAVASRLGVDPRESLYTVMGGNYVQTLVNRTAVDIAEGRNDLVLLCGGEAWRTRSDARKSDIDLGWSTQPEDTPPATSFGDDENLVGPAELALGIVMPAQVYPMFDVALRAADGITIDEHRRRIATLWAGFSEIAAANPYAWIRTPMTADEIAEATPSNRMIGFPYTKVLNSNNMVDQGAALIMCSAERATELGVPTDRWVHLHAGADAHDHWFVSNRDELYTSPAMRLASAKALELIGAGVDDLAHVDLYSCFPSAVQIAAREIGLGLDRQLTVTGGMSFAGGPWNNYVMHAIATMAGVLREDPGALGMCTANGGYTTKHAFGLYSTTPPAAGEFRWADVQAEVDALPSREVTTDHEGAVTVEAYTVMHGRGGEPERGIFALRTAEGARAWGSTEDADTMQVMVAEELVGRAATRRADGQTDLA